MNFYALLYRLRWIHTPAGILMMLLQRTPVLRLLTGGTAANVGLQSGELLKSAFALAALGAYNSVAGATVFNATAVSPTTVTPASGGANTTFTTSGAANAALSIAFSGSGAPGTIKSWKVTGTLPSGVSVSGGTPVTGGYIYNGLKVTLAGTPAASDHQTLKVTAYDTTGATGNNASITCVLDITGVASAAPAFTTQPVSQTVTAGATVTFTTAVTGSPAPTLQWYKDNSALPGQTGSSLVLAGVQSGDSGSYTVVATNSSAPSGVSSSAATLTVNPAPVAPVFTTQPVSQTVTLGDNVTFTAAATGSPAPTFQWYKDNLALSGQTGDTLSLTGVQPVQAGTYAVKAVNAASPSGVSSAFATLAVQVPAPAALPASRAYYIGERLGFDLTGGHTYPAGVTFYGSGLPAGVTINPATGLLSGLLTGKAAVYTVSCWTQSGTALSTKRTFTLTVAGYPASLAGKFETLIDDTSPGAVAPLPLGKAEILVTAATGAFTGKLTTTDTAVYALKGVFEIGADLTTAGKTLTITRTAGLVPATYQLALAVSNTGALTATLSANGGTLGTGTGSKLAGTSSAATYTMIVRSPANLGSITTYPHGDGYFSVVSSTLGVFTLKGKLGDGTIATALLALGADNQLRPYLKPYKAAPGYLAGTLKLTARSDNAALSHLTADNGGDFYWVKPALAVTPAYPAGFGPLAVQAVMEPWTALPATNFGPRLGLAPDGNFTVTILGDYQSNTGPGANTALPATLNLSATNVLTVVGANTSTWLLKLTGTTGVFTGTCYPTDKLATHKTTISGVLLQPAPGDTLIGGSYLFAPAQNLSQAASTSSVEFTAP